MKFRSIVKMLVIGLWACGASAEAQSLSRGIETGSKEACRVVDKGFVKRLRQRMELQDELRGLTSRPEDLNKYPFILQKEKIYILRLAVGISGEGYASGLQSKEADIPQYLDNLETALNKVYERDCGIRMQVIRDERLYLWKNDKVKHRPDYSEGTQLINDAIGSESYDIGIIMTGNSGGLRGLAVLGGVDNQGNKANAIAVSDPTTMAHELGHLLGAEHTHDNTLHSIQIEPGNGRSIMSYGSDRTFFALPSIRAMRISCEGMKHYNEQRTQVIKEGNSTDVNGLVAIPFVGQVPKLKKEELKSEYRVTRGTYFQFVLPVERHEEGFRYNAHLIDREKVGASNTMQCFYESFTQPAVMFHPRYQAAGYTRESNYKVFGVSPIPYSDHYRVGTFTYALSASHKGQHDSYVTRLNIVEGEQFKITSVSGIDSSTSTATSGSPLNITWQPCHQLYKNHRVRILLSDDFGQTFKYVLADSYPNTGQWSGHWPYVKVGKVDYPAYSETLKYKPVKDIRAGVIKVEVLGEVAYSLSEVRPYTTQQTSVIPTGGFMLDAPRDKSLTFAREDGRPLPPQYLEVATRAEIEQMPRLRASLGSNALSVVGDETPEGHLLKRQWRSTIGGVTSTYTQLIKILNEEEVEPAYKRRLSAIRGLAYDLYQHIGKLAYPRADLAQSQRLKSDYPTFYDESGNLKANLKPDEAERFIKLVESFSDLNEADIVMPLSGAKYYIKSYSITYTGDKYYYLKAQPSDYYNKEKLVLSKSEATAWSHQEVDGVHHFTAESHNLYLAQTLKNKKGTRLVRGVTWGAFSFISQDSTPRIAQASNNGVAISFNDSYHQNPLEHRTNKPGNTVSTDFQLELVDESFDIYFVTRTWSSLSASFVGSKASTTLSPVADGANRYRITIPSGCGSERIRFSGNVGSPLEVQLSGRSETYSEEGGRRHQLLIPSNGYTTLYLDYAVRLPEGVKAFTAKLQAQTAENVQPKSYALKLTPVALGRVPTRTAVIIYAQTAGPYELVEETGVVSPIRENVLVGAMTEIAPTSIDTQDYHYYDLMKPTGNPSTAGSTLTYPTLDTSKPIPANTAYLNIYKYENGNYNLGTITLSTDELSQEAERPKEPKKPSEPTPNPPVTPEPPAPTPPDTPTPNPPTPPEPPTPPSPPVTPPVTPDPPAPNPPTPPTPPNNPNEGGGEGGNTPDNGKDDGKKPDDNGGTTDDEDKPDNGKDDGKKPDDNGGTTDDEDKPDNGKDDGKKPDDNGTTNEPNKPDETAGEQGTLDKPYSARGVARHEIAPSRNVWVRGLVLGWLDDNGQIVARPTGVVALGGDRETYIPIYIPEAYRVAVGAMQGEVLYAEGKLSQYKGRKGIAPEGFVRLRSEHRELSPDKPQDTPTEDALSPYAWQGYIYDLKGNIVGKGNFRDLPRGIYILGGKKHLKH